MVSVGEKREYFGGYLGLSICLIFGPIKDVTSLRIILAGGSALSVESRETINAAFLKFQNYKPIIAQVYGSTELGMASFRYIIEQEVLSSHL